MTLRVLVLIAAVLTVASAFAQGDLAHAPMQLTLQAPPVLWRAVPSDRDHGFHGGGVAAPDLPRRFRRASAVGRTDGCRTTPAARPGRKRAIGAATAPTSSARPAANGEQQIYVDPRYGGRATTPLGLDPFKVQDGVLSIVASRTPPELKAGAVQQ